MFRVKATVEKNAQGSTGIGSHNKSGSKSPGWQMDVYTGNIEVAVG